MTHAARAERPRLFWSHSIREPRGFRWFSYIRNRDFLSIELTFFTSLAGVGITTMHGKWTFKLCVGLFAFFLSWPARYRAYGEDREVSINFYHGSISWSFWTDPMSWSSLTPKWRQGSFNFVDFLLGRSKCEHHTIEERNVLIPMPERAYQATAKLEQWTWRRPRWFAKSFNRVTIDIPKGIPFPGKGENSWDCGDDATYGIATGPCNSIAEGVGVLVGSVLRSRVRHGGYSTWTWQESEASP